MVLNRNRLYSIYHVILMMIIPMTGILAQVDIEELENQPTQFIEEYNQTIDSTQVVYNEAIESEYQDYEVKEIEQEKLNEKPVWSDEAWKESIKDVRYERDQKKEEETETPEIEETTPIAEESIDLSDWLQNIFLSDLAKIICIVIVIGLLTFLIIQLTRARIKSAKIKVQNVSMQVPENLNEELPESDLERYLKIALEKSDFKTAVRILYLMTIQKMNDLELIRWKKDKTNRDYLNEMRQRHDYNEFRELTLMYEVVWYGERGVERFEFDQVRGAFDQYKKKLSATNETR